MKKMKKIYWMLFIILCAACNDPYDGDTYVVFDMQPAGTYLSNRSDDFSEWMNSGLFDKFIIMCVHEIIILENSLLHNSYFRESHFL